MSDKQGKNHMGAWGDFAPECLKEPWEMSKEPPKIPINTMLSVAKFEPYVQKELPTEIKT